MRRPLSRRHGISLIEVVVASGVLAMGIGAIAHLSYIGLKSAADARDLAIVQSECQTRLNELIAGARPLQPTSGEFIAGLPEWSLAVEILPTPLPAVACVRVTARKQHEWANASTNAGFGPDAFYALEFTLTRWIARPTATSGSGQTAATAGGVPSAVPPAANTLGFDSLGGVPGLDPPTWAPGLGVPAVPDMAVPPAIPWTPPSDMGGNIPSAVPLGLNLPPGMDTAPGDGFLIPSAVPSQLPPREPGAGI